MSLRAGTDRVDFEAFNPPDRDVRRHYGGAFQPAIEYQLDVAAYARSRPDIGRAIGRPVGSAAHRRR
jgi:hypothetical protein